LSPMNPLVPFFLRPLMILKFYEGSKEDQKEHITWRTSMSMKATSQMELCPPSPCSFEKTPKFNCHLKSCHTVRSPTPLCFLSLQI
jgi:hypothetical protein